MSHDQWLACDAKKRKSLFSKLSTEGNDEFKTSRSFDNTEKKCCDNVFDTDFPPFELSGLPDSYKTDWNGVQYYLKN